MQSIKTENHELFYPYPDKEVAIAGVQRTDHSATLLPTYARVYKQQ